MRPLLAAAAWLLCAAVASAADTPILLTLQPELAMCECAGHRPAAFGAQVAGSTTLDEQLAAGATLTPLVRSYHRATAAESLAAIEADMAREADRGDEAADRGDDAAFRES